MHSADHWSSSFSVFLTSDARRERRLRGWSNGGLLSCSFSRYPSGIRMSAGRDSRLFRSCRHQNKYLKYLIFKNKKNQWKHCQHTARNQEETPTWLTTKWHLSRVNPGETAKIWAGNRERIVCVIKYTFTSKDLYRSVQLSGHIRRSTSPSAAGSGCSLLGDVFLALLILLFCFCVFSKKNKHPGQYNISAVL